MHARLAAVALAGAAALIAGCGGSAPEPSAAGEGTVVAKPVSPPDLPDLQESTPDNSLPASGADLEAPEPAAASPSEPRGMDILSAADRASFQRLADELGGESGLAVSGLGLGGEVERVGSLRSGAAWSTAKVPIAMAVIDAGGGAAAQPDLTAAITASDNAAAERLWASLGAPETAAAAATEQLRAAGDTRTTVEARTLRSGYTAFGQTAWSVADQARFAAGLPCSASGTQVLALMGDVVSGQRWGLGSVGDGAQLKGGWGPGSEPGASGGYLDRQLGVVTIDGTPLAVALATRPGDGTHETGTRNLTALARWLSEHADVRDRPQAAAC